MEDDPAPADTIPDDRQEVLDRWSDGGGGTFTTYGPAYIVHDGYHDDTGYGHGGCVSGVNPVLAALTLGGAALAAFTVFQQITNGGRRRRRSVDYNDDDDGRFDLVLLGRQSPRALISS